MDMPLHQGFPVAPRSRVDIRHAAVNARNVLDLPEGRIAITMLLDKLTLFGIHYDVLDSTDWPEAREVEACYYPEERTLYIRDSIYREMAKGGQRAVFTFGHELGHAVLAHRRAANRQSVASVPTYAQSEWQANFFSAEFTMPLDQIKRRALLNPEAIAAFFGVSLAAARVRYVELRKKGEL
jgi:hypothetical protein